MELILGIIAIVIFILWLQVIVDAKQFEIKAASFAPLKNSPPVQDILVSIIIPARNEELTLPACLDSLVAQTHQNLEIILINDRSTDKTGEVMRSYVSRFQKCEYIEITDLPADWLGKNNALHVGSEKARGEFILFTDGDILFAPQTLATALSVAVGHKLDHLVVTPRFLSRGYILAAMQCFFSMLFISLIKPGKIGTSNNFYIGAGAFNFVKRDTYLKIKGHHTLRMEIIDDVMLGKQLTAGGGKTGFIDGNELLSLEWYPSWWAMIKGLEKNGFAAFRYSLLKLLWVTLSMTVHHLLPYIAVFFTHGWVQGMFIADLILIHLLFAVVAVKMHYSPLVTFLIPIAAWLVYFAHLRSTVLALFRGHIAWRDTKYALSDLKKNKV